jgi:muconolactone delta-isomerase
MTTAVPDGVSEAEVAAVREREAARSQQLTREGRLRRLWRPPLQPGEWRSIGLFIADGETDLEQTLASMPLRIWRTDEVTPLGAHPNDLGRDRVALDLGSTEFLTTFVVAVPTGTSSDVVAETTTREAGRTSELAAEGSLLRLWTLHGHGRVLGHWQASGPDRMRDIVRSLPMADWLAVDTLELTRHPSDPATAGAIRVGGGQVGSASSIAVMTGGRDTLALSESSCPD